MKLDALHRRTVCNLYQDHIRAHFEGIAKRHNCEVKARKEAKGMKRLMEKTGETLTILLSCLSSKVADQKIYSLLKMAGDFCVDVNGVTLIADSLQQMRRLFEEVQEANWDTHGMALLRWQNGFNESRKTWTGYRDLKCWLLVKVGDDAPPMTVEAQFHLRPFYARKETLMHLPYEIGRGDFDFPVSAYVKEQQGLEMMRWEKGQDQALKALTGAMQNLDKRAIRTAIAESEALELIGSDLKMQIKSAKERLETIHQQELEATIFQLQEAVSGKDIEALRAALKDAQAKGVASDLLITGKQRLLELEDLRKKLNLALVALDAASRDYLVTIDELEACIARAEIAGAPEEVLSAPKQRLVQLKVEEEAKWRRLQAEEEAEQRRQEEIANQQERERLEAERKLESERLEAERKLKEEEERRQAEEMRRREQQMKAERELQEAENALQDALGAVDQLINSCQWGTAPGWLALSQPYPGDNVGPTIENLDGCIQRIEHIDDIFPTGSSVKLSASTSAALDVVGDRKKELKEAAETFNKSEECQEKQAEALTNALAEPKVEVLEAMLEWAIAMEDAQEREARLQGYQEKITAAETAMSNETASIASLKEKVAAEMEACTAAAAQAAAIKEDAQRFLEPAMPALEASVNALKSLQLAHMAELNTMKKPPAMVVLTLKVVCIFLGMKPTEDYGEIKKKLHINDPKKFLQTLFEFDKDNISDETAEKYKPHLEREDFHPDVVRKSNHACTGLCMWCRAMDTYHRTAQAVKPKRAALIEAEENLAKLNQSLAKGQAELAECLSANRTNELTDAFEAAGKYYQKMKELSELFVTNLLPASCKEIAKKHLSNRRAIQEHQSPEANLKELEKLERSRQSAHAQLQQCLDVDHEGIEDSLQRLEELGVFGGSNVMAARKKLRDLQDV
eukprot:gnl/MRDRNA2_/MRDRNA2_69858_c0_seq1.p1 gnl/MRDRNA2_/MRDRNA2_69858_c0~~gnl/MRDRNA2_/MRDRNA2_69858_c0_seq1.p1  ORF type:complete len:1053 (+),score=289.97 gnl/MRDRNA2_/MRDRNA2_69858_c0_seq1:420-3161(+)